MGACIEATLLVDDNRRAQVHILASYLLLSQRKSGSLLSLMLPNLTKLNTEN
jgi:hypothetical protein